MSWFLHPGDRQLNRFADGELEERAHTRIAAHLADCSRCREEVALIRRMGEAARAIPTPVATDAILQRALARRRAGERVLLPMSDAGAPRRSTRRYAPAAIAAMLTLIVASLVISVRALEADRPALQIHPERPSAGELLRIEYRGGALFEDEPHLVLRTRFRTGDDRHWQLIGGILARSDDGVFRGEVQLPDSVVYAAFAVEDLQAERLDSRNRQLWDVMVHEDGQPTLAAMAARLRDLEPRDWGEAYEVAREMARKYPDAPQSWATLFSYEMSLFERDSVFAHHRQIFAGLERRLAGIPSPDPVEMAWLGTYAVSLGDVASASHWIERALDRAPGDAAVANAQVLLLGSAGGFDPKQLLDRVEEVWTTLPHGSPAIAHVGWQLARLTGEAPRIRQWTSRYLAHRPSERVGAVPIAYATPDLWSELIDWARDVLEEPHPELEPSRPLYLPAHLHARRRADQIQTVLGSTAAKARSNGDIETATELAGLGLDLSWETAALSEFARTLSAAGDDEAALSALTRVAADPTVRDLRELGLRPPSGEEWASRVATAEAALRSHVLAEAIVEYLPERIDVTRDGPLELMGMLKGQPTVVVFLSRYCAPALQEAVALETLAEGLRPLGARVVAIDVDNGGLLEPYLRELGFTGSVVEDRHGEARTAFASSATADYYVVDAAGRVRFEHSSPDEVVRQIWALTEGSAAELLVTD